MFGGGVEDGVRKPKGRKHPVTHRRRWEGNAVQCIGNVSTACFWFKTEISGSFLWTRQ